MTEPTPDPTDPLAAMDEADLAAVGRRHPILTRMGSMILLAIGVAFVVLSMQLPFGSFLQPDTGTWPTIVSVSLVILAAISLAFPELEAEFLDTLPSELRWFLLGLVVCILFVVLFRFTGYFLSTTVFVFATAMIFARPAWWKAALVAVGAGAGLWVLFAVVLDLPAPS